MTTNGAALPWTFIRGQIRPLEEARIPITTHALSYGTGCFEGIRGNWNPATAQLNLFRMREHYARLKASACVLHVEIAQSVDELCDLTVELAARNGFRGDVYIRPIAYKAGEVIGVRLHDVADDLAIFMAPFAEYLDAQHGLRCRTSSWRRVPNSVIPARAKATGKYVNSALAKTEAWALGFDEAMMLTTEGMVSEGSAENVFIVRDGRLATPSATEDILVGITRDTVMEIAREELGIATAERAISLAELYEADECFMTGTAAHVTPVVEVDQVPIGTGRPGPLTCQLIDLYGQLIRGEIPRYRTWCTAVPLGEPVTRSGHP